MKKRITLTFLVLFCLAQAGSGLMEFYRTKCTELLSPTMFKMLGMLGEYISRFNYNTGNPRKNLVEMFFPREEMEGYLFEKLIQQYRQEMNLDFQYTKSIGPQGHIRFMSPKLSRIINSFYTRRGRHATLDPAIFDKADTGSKYAFIEGVYLRFHYDYSNLIRMANALNKMETIASVLKSLKCKVVYIYATQITIPRAIDVLFEPTDRLRKLLSIEIELSRQELIEQHRGIKYSLHKEY